MKKYISLCMVIGTMFFLSLCSSVQAQKNMVEITGGSYSSILPDTKGEPVSVSPFYLDKYLVSNGDYLKFVEENPEWRKSLVSPLYADKDYLSHWKSDLNPGDGTNARLDQPITHVSWFAASAYARWSYGRLATLHEWEYAAQLLNGNKNGRQLIGNKLIGWFSAVETKNPSSVTEAKIKNSAGVEGLHGIVLEWVQDFNPPLADNQTLDCGTVGRLGSGTDTYDYAATIRYVIRMNMDAKNCTSLFGFRVAYSDMNSHKKENL